MMACWAFAEKEKSSNKDTQYFMAFFYEYVLGVIGS
jgi:hypothetical protein